MNRNEEMKERAEKLNKLLIGKSYSIKVHECFKNNIMKVGYSLYDRQNHAAPTLYFENLKDYWNSDEDIISYLDSVYEANANVKINPSEILTHDNILSRVKPKLVADSNIGYVEKSKIVHRRFLDMLVLFYIDIPEFDECATVTLKEENIMQAGISVEKLYDNAVAHIDDDYSINDIRRIICQMLEPELQCDALLDDSDTPYMLVASNTGKLYGASVMLSKRVLNELSICLKGDVIIIPSSVHECIAIPASGESPDDIREIVREVNDTEVELEDRLTYSIYLYSNGSLNIY